MSARWFLTTDWKGFAAHRMLDGRVDVSIWNSSTAYYEVLHIAVELGKVYAAKGNFDRNGNITFGLRDSRKIENSYQSVKKSLANKTAQSIRHSYGLH